MNLTSEQVWAVREGEPISIIPPEVGEECVLLRKDIYEKVKKATGDELPSSLAISGLLAAVMQDEDFDDYQQYKR